MEKKTPGYYRSRVYAGRVMFLSEYFSGRMGRRGRGSPPQKKSTYEIAMAHWRRQKKELAILVNANFRAERDQSVTLEWGRDDIKPETKEEVQQAATNFVKRLRRWYRDGHTVYRMEPVLDGKGNPVKARDGTARMRREVKAVYPPKPELKYIYTMEIGPRGSRHIHILISDADKEEIEDCWRAGVPNGNIDGRRLYKTDQDYSAIANYYMKYTEPKKPDPNDTEEPEGEKLGKRWYASQNLYRPEPIVRKISEKTFSEDLPDVEGYHINPDSTNGGVETDGNGRPFRECVYVMNDTAKECRMPLRRGRPRKRKTRKKVRGPGRRRA